jgi:hypothetical protein
VLTIENFPVAAPLLDGMGMRLTRPPTIAKLALEFTPAAGDQRQTRLATRIALDGKGGLIIYDGLKARERLALHAIQDIRIKPLAPPQQAGSKPCRKPVMPAMIATFDLLIT